LANRISIHFNDIGFIPKGWLGNRQVKAAFFLSFILCSLISYAQEQESLDTNPPSVKWQQVNTPYFRVLFPKGFEAQGQRVANTLEYIRKAESKSLGAAPRLLTVILQNQSSESNGFVSVLPRRSEFFAMPSQNYNFLGTNDWLDLLASHEFRHVVQFQHANRGFNRAFYYLFGATTMAAMAQAAAPQWFWEGDAVVTETAFTRSGRGKIPNFSLVFKTNLLEGRTFNYHKQYLRSYKHNIPNHYVLGYHMVSYLRKRTNDPEIWSKITARSWSVPFIPFTFSTSIKKYSGLSVTGLYREMASNLKKEWQAQIDSLTLTKFARISAKRHGYTDYLYPQEMNNGNVVVVKTGIGDIATFVIVNKDQQKIFIPGFINDSGMLSAQGSTIVWNEYGYDPRWTIRNYSLIKVYDLKKKKRIVIGGKQTRYTSAAMSPDETKIVAMRTNTDYKTQMIVLSYPDGKVVKEFPNPENSFYSMPRWSDDGNKIVSLKTNAEGKAIVLIDSNSGEENEVMPFSNENTGYPVLCKNYLFFNSPITGIDNIFALDLNTRKRFQVTTSKYAAYNAAVSKDGKTIYYNEQTKDGLDVVKIPFDPASWKNFEGTKQENVTYEYLVDQEGDQHLFNNIPTQPLAVTRYHKANGIINPYTWGFFVNNALTQGNIGITSQDLLSTTRVSVGYNFDITERTSSWLADVSYQGLYPIINVSASAADRSVNETFDGDIYNFRWTEQKLEGGLQLPLVTTSSRYAGNISIGDKVGLTHVRNFKNGFDNSGSRDFNGAFFAEYLSDGNLLYNNATFSASRLLKKSRRDIYSKWGQSIDATFFSTPFIGDFNGQLLAVTGIAYFPGLAKHHSLWGYSAYQQTQIVRSSDLYFFRNQVPTPRGHAISRFQDFYSSSVNYTMPVWYPDIAIGPFVNFQRIRTNVFFDYAFGQSLSFNQSQQYSSVGVEAKVDLNIMRFLPQFNLGVRFSHGLTPAVNKFEILIGTINL
jgi:hypothetical protein